MNDKYTDEPKMNSFEWDIMKEEYRAIAEQLLNKYGPEGSYEITKLLNKLIDNDIHNYEK